MPLYVFEASEYFLRTDLIEDDDETETSSFPVLALRRRVWSSVVKKRKVEVLYACECVRYG